MSVKFALNITDVWLIALINQFVSLNKICFVLSRLQSISIKVFLIHQACDFNMRRIYRSCHEWISNVAKTERWWWIKRCSICKKERNLFVCFVFREKHNMKNLHVKKRKSKSSKWWSTLWILVTYSKCYFLHYVEAMRMKLI